VELMEPLMGKEWVCLQEWQGDLHLQA